MWQYFTSNLHGALWLELNSLPWSDPLNDVGVAPLPFQQGPSRLKAYPDREIEYMAVLELDIEIETPFGLIDFDRLKRFAFQESKGNYGRAAT
jgi:hypothetical protein